MVRITTSIIARISLAFLTAFLLGGCNPDNQPSAPDKGSAEAQQLLPLSFYHIQDADGQRPGEGVDVVLLFEPDGIADLYVARDDEAIAYKGTYSCANNVIALKFNDIDFKRDVSFTIDTAETTISLPFMAFSNSPGTSTWRRHRKPLEHNLHLVFAAATLAENLPTAQAINRTVAYANAIRNISSLQKTALASASAAPAITSIAPFENGVAIQYDHGPTVNIELFDWSLGSGKPMRLSPLASDPRVHLDPASPHNGAADPPEKTALFIAPFDSDRETVTWYDYAFLNRRTVTPSEPVHRRLGEAFKVTEMASTLESNGYRVTVLRDADVNLVNMIEALIPGKGARAHSPGFISMMTHGLGNGNLLTGTILGNSKDWRDEFADQAALLKARGYGDLLTYGGGTEQRPLTIAATVLTKSMRPGGGLIYSLTVTPKFWEWLRTRQADFSRSLVFVAACLTDLNADLREAVRARAYFAYDAPVSINFAAKSLQYFCKSLARPTHSAEETYYNLLRVMNTKQMIYAEDKILDGLAGADAAQGDSALLFFRGYGYTGQKVISYSLGGWFNTADADLGAIWWLLFSGRWGQDAKAGSDGMLSCWQSFWKDGKTGGLANPACHNKTPGRAPTHNEVAYASYLLNGTPVLGLGNATTMIPRWTLNDGR